MKMINSYYQNTGAPSFNGIRRAKYTHKKPPGGGSGEITIYELEPRDIDFLEKLNEKARNNCLITEQSQDTMNNRSLVHQEILGLTIIDAIKTLWIKKVFNYKVDPTTVYMAVQDKKPYGLLIGNMPRVNNTTKQIVYS